MSLWGVIGVIVLLVLALWIALPIIFFRQLDKETEID